jgi:ubiquinone/menaquinone biosynthesis C-methylase UbiE
MHGEDPAHTFALSFLTSVVDHLQVHSILDVGAGTGRVGAFLAEKRPETNVIGIEPVSELRERGHEKGVPRSRLIEGVADALPFENKSFDLVCAFGVMHHLVDPSKAALEMLRVARRAVFISDHNDYGRGTAVTTTLKQAPRRLGYGDSTDFSSPEERATGSLKMMAFGIRTRLSTHLK